MAIRVGSKKDSYGRLSRYYNLKDADRLPKYLSNYFGDGSDLDLHVTSDLQLASTQDGDMVVKNYKNLTIDAGATLTVSDRCRGLFLFVNGNLTGSSDPANPAIISMKARGCHANPADSGVTSDTPVAPSDGNAVHTDGIQIPFVVGGETDALDAHFEGCGNDAYALNAKYAELVGEKGKLIIIPRVGGAGGGIPDGTTPIKPGEAGVNGQSGGGGAGGYYSSTSHGGSGSAGTCFSGGVGGGGEGQDGSQYNAAPYGGEGGDAANTTSDYHSGGIGNPNGTGGSALSTLEGTGGLLIIVVGGQISGYINIVTDGVDCDADTSNSSGGSSGAGPLVFACRGNKPSSINLSADGGVSKLVTTGDQATGSDGGSADIMLVEGLV